MSRNAPALENLQRVFPYGVRSKNGTFRSWFCTEKPYSMRHCQWADNYAAVGPGASGSHMISTSVTETRMKTAVKTPSLKTNNQASFGGSLLKNNMEVEAAMDPGAAAHLESCTPGTWQYKMVCTGTSQYVPYSIQGRTRNLKMVHTSTYQHR
jgi:hypothetical protein